MIAVVVMVEVVETVVSGAYGDVSFCLPIKELEGSKYTRDSYRLLPRFQTLKEYQQHTCEANYRD